MKEKSVFLRKNKSTSASTYKNKEMNIKNTNS